MRIYQTFKHNTFGCDCRVYDQYSFNVIPPMGQVVAGDWASYQYLVQSIRKFPDQVCKGIHLMYW